jgi:hypothetical protein
VNKDDNVDVAKVEFIEEDDGFCAKMHPFSATIKNVLKSTPGAKYLPDKKGWFIPQEEKNNLINILNSRK